MRTLRRSSKRTRIPPLSDPERLRREADDLEDKLRRLIRNMESGNQKDLHAITYELRKLLKNEVDTITRLARELLN